MELSFCCPKCKHPVSEDLHNYYCKNCESTYNIKDGYVDFMEGDFYAGEVTRAEITSLISNIDKRGYDYGLQEFISKNPELRDYMLDESRADWLYHCSGVGRGKCLDIGSGLGNISEILSRNFEQVYSLEAVRERIEFQKRRYKKSNRKNIILIRANAIQLPFPENFFDLVICNGVLEWIASLSPNLDPRKAQLMFLSEIKRVLCTGGCAYIGIENRLGFPFLLGALDHSGIRYTSLMPRKLASFLVNRFGKTGGIYGGSTDKKETRGYTTYTYTLGGYKKLFDKIGLKTKSFWVIPSYNKPHVSGRTDDDNALKAYIGYYLNTYRKFKLPLTILYNLNKSITQRLGNFLTPSFLFFCYKDRIHESFDESSIRETMLPSFVRISTGAGVMYIMYDDKTNASKVVHSKRPNYGPLNQIPFRDKSNPDFKDFDQNVWVENWIKGRQLNPLNINESRLALKWLFDYQRNNGASEFTSEELQSQVSELKVKLAMTPEIKAEKYLDYLDKYKVYLNKLKINRVCEHGDFFYSNIIVDKSASELQVIDWEYYRENGDPFFDLMFYVLTSLELPSESPDAFKNNLDGKGKFIKILRYLKPMIDKHYGQNIDFDKLLPYTLTRFIVRKYVERGKFDGIVIHYQKLFDILAEQEFKLNL